MQELRCREEELTNTALQQKIQEQELKKREQEIAEREIELVERELNILIMQQVRLSLISIGLETVNLQECVSIKLAHFSHVFLSGREAADTEEAEGQIQETASEEPQTQSGQEHQRTIR